MVNQCKLIKRFSRILENYEDVKYFKQKIQSYADFKEDIIFLPLLSNLVKIDKNQK